MAAPEGPLVPPSDPSSSRISTNPLPLAKSAEVLSSSMAPPVITGPVHDPAVTDSGEPAIFFSKEEIQVSQEPFAYSLVSHTPFGRPSFQNI